MTSCNILFLVHTWCCRFSVVGSGALGGCACIPTEIGQYRAFVHTVIVVNSVKTTLFTDIGSHQSIA